MHFWESDGLGNNKIRKGRNNHFFFCHHPNILTNRYHHEYVDSMHQFRFKPLRFLSNQQLQNPNMNTEIDAMKPN